MMIKKTLSQMLSTTFLFGLVAIANAGELDILIKDGKGALLDVITFFILLIFLRLLILWFL